MPHDLQLPEQALPSEQQEQPRFLFLYMCRSAKNTAAASSTTSTISTRFMPALPFLCDPDQQTDEAHDQGGDPGDRTLP